LKTNAQFRNVKSFFRKLLRELRVFYRLFSKESVFKYLLVIVTLMVVAGIAFMILEYDRVLAANPGKTSLTWFDKIVTVMYWAIVTVSTCGYGDIAPGTNAGRIMVIVLLYLSIAAVSLFTANLSSALTAKKLMERRGIMDPSELNDHFIICGWKTSMAKMLSNIVEHNPELSLGKLVVIANIEPDVIELFKQQYPEYDDIQILRGEHFNETLLRKANVKDAAKVLILADDSTKATATEIDSKTIMAAMTIRALSVTTKITAELLDVKFERYLQSAQVEEIIYTNEYSHALVASSFLKTGLAKVVNEILDINTAAYITTESFPLEYCGMKFGELRSYFRENQNAILIGLVENVGNYLDRKAEAIREAQKTADVSQLIDNLKAAKKMENNLPNINPGDDYPVPLNSLAVVVGKRA
jgi:voltage-gated potassium channel